MKPRNDRALALSAFCVELEEHRRTPEGRVRDAEAFLSLYFSRSGDGGATDRLFVHLPHDVRGPILAGWHIRGLKAALRDDDDRVKAVVLDALDAGDLDATMFEEGVRPETLVDHVPLDEWWSFWRGKAGAAGAPPALPNAAVQKALAIARARSLVDDPWFLENVSGRGGKLKGTDAVCDTLTKDEIAGWIRGVHASGDASPAGLVAARGWDNVLAKTSPEGLLAALDAFARKVGLVAAPPEAAKPLSRPPLAAAVPPSAAAVPASAAAVPASAAAVPPSAEAVASVDPLVNPSTARIGLWPEPQPSSSWSPGEPIDDDEPEPLITPDRPPAI